MCVCVLYVNIKVNWIPELTNWLDWPDNDSGICLSPHAQNYGCRCVWPCLILYVYYGYRSSSPHLQEIFPIPTPKITISPLRKANIPGWKYRYQSTSHKRIFIKTYPLQWQIIHFLSVTSSGLERHVLCIYLFLLTIPSIKPKASCVLSKHPLTGQHPHILCVCFMLTITNNFILPSFKWNKITAKRKLRNERH